MFVGLSVLSWSGFKLFVRSKPSLTISSLRFCRFVSLKNSFDWFSFFDWFFLLLVSFCVIMAKWITKKLWFSMQNAKTNIWFAIQVMYWHVAVSQNEFMIKFPAKKNIGGNFWSRSRNKNWKFGGTTFVLKLVLRFSKNRFVSSFYG